MGYRTINFLVILALLMIVASCLDSRIERKDSDSEELSSRKLEQLESESTALSCIESLGQDLLAGGIERSQVAALMDGAAKTVVAENLASTDRVELLVPGVIQGVERSMSLSSAGTSGMTSERTPSAANGQKEIIEILLESGISFAKGRETADLDAFLQTVTETSVSYLDEAGVDSSLIDTMLEAVVKGAVQGLKKLDQSNDAIASKADSIAKGIILGFENSNIPKSEFGNKVTTLKTSIHNVLQTSGIPQATIDSHSNELDQALIDARGNITGITINSAKNLYTTESGGSFSFGIVLNTKPVNDVYISISSSATDEGDVSPDSLVFSITNWNVVQSVKVTGIDDDSVDGSQHYSIIIDQAVSTDSDYNTLNPDDLSVINLDNDQILSVDPKAGEKNVLKTCSINVYFAADMSGINSDAFTVNDGSDDISGTVNYDISTDIATFIPDSPLRVYNRYSVLFGIEVAELGGLNQELYSWTFTTESDFMVMGDYHTCFKSVSGNVKCWGRSNHGQLGLEGTENQGDEPGEVAALSDIDMGSGRSVIRLAAGQYHNCALLDNGSVKCWGRNNYGQLGTETDVEYLSTPTAVSPGSGKIIDVAAGYGHSCVLFDNGSLRCWGYNRYGQLGLNSTNEEIGNDPGEISGLTDIEVGTGRTVTRLAAGYRHNCAILDNAKVKCWGYNNYGQLGLGDTETRGDGTGDSVKEMADALPYVELGAGRTVKSIAAGSYHNCAILDNDVLKCWGKNNNGQLGLMDPDYRGDDSNEMGDNLPAVDLGSGRYALKVTAGANHTCALLDDNTVKCWGWGLDGRIGMVYDKDSSLKYVGDAEGEMGDTLSPVSLGSDRTVLDLYTARAQNCVLLDNMKIKCFGFNYYGNLGNGNTDDLGDETNEMGDNLPYLDVTLE